jgi:lactoylglutathione lyase
MLSLLVLRSANINKSKRFYEQLGFVFEHHQHGKGTPHLAATMAGFVFEIYPAQGMDTSATRLGFAVEDVAQAIGGLVSVGGQVISQPRTSPWGLRAVVMDPDGHKVELMEKT